MYLEIIKKKFSMKITLLIIFKCQQFLARKFYDLMALNCFLLDVLDTPALFTCLMWEKAIGKHTGDMPYSANSVFRLMAAMAYSVCFFNPRHELPYAVWTMGPVLFDMFFLSHFQRCQFYDSSHLNLPEAISWKGRKKNMLSKDRGFIPS